MIEDAVFTLQRACDVYLRHCFLYYVHGTPKISDQEFDLMRAYFKRLYPDCSVFDWVGSDRPWNYPDHIRDGFRPTKEERGAYHRITLKST